MVKIKKETAKPPRCFLLIKEGRGKAGMSRKMEKRRAKAICVYALKHGQTAAGIKFKMSKQRVSKVFRCHVSTVMMQYEITDKNGKQKKFKDLQEIFKRPL